MYVNAKNISLHIIASAGMAMSMSIIACHFIPLLLGGNGNKNESFTFPSISLQFHELNIKCIARV